MADTRFKKGQVPHNKKTPEELEASKKRWREGTRLWHKNNKKRINERRRLKRQTDLSFKIAGNLRKRVSFLIRKASTTKTKQTLKLLGCSMEYFLHHLQSQFSEGMSFENYGQWHIDHIKPCDTFDLTDPKQQEICFHYTNMQPLWAIDNRMKSNKIAA